MRDWRPDWPCPVGPVLALHRRGGGDPTYRLDGERHWRGIRTPTGPATLLVESRSTEGVVHAEAWGPGADWVLESLPALLGADDDLTGFDPGRHPLVAEAWRRYHHGRIGRTGLVMEALTPAVIEQKVTGQEAFAGFRMLVHRYGERAPGPGVELKPGCSPVPRPSGGFRRGSGCACTSTRRGLARSSPPPGWPTRSSAPSGCPGTRSSGG